MRKVFNIGRDRTCSQSRPCREVGFCDGGTRRCRSSLGIGFDLEFDGDGSREEGLKPLLLEALSKQIRLVSASSSRGQKPGTRTKAWLVLTLREETTFPFA